MDIKKILVLRPDMIGDLMLITPALSALRKKFPQAEITLLIQSYTKDAVKNHPDIDKLIEVPKRGFGNTKKFFELLDKIKKEKFDLAINYYNEFPYAFLGYAAGIPYRLGDKSKILIGWMYNLAAFQQWRDYTRHEVEQNLALLRPLEITEQNLPMKTAVNPQAKESVLQKIPSRRPLIVVHLGTGGGNKPYLPEYFAKTIDLLKEKLKGEVVITGAKREQEKADKVMELCKNKPVNLVQNTTLEELIALIGECGLFIGVDSGPLHIASALKRKIIAIFPSKEVKPSKWGPWQAEHIVLHNPYGCKLTCFVRRCHFNTCSINIKPEEIYEAAKKLLAGDAGDSRTDWYKKSLNILILAKASKEADNYIYELKKNGFYVKRLDHIPPLMSLLKFYGSEDINIVHQLGSFGLFGNLKVLLSRLLSSLFIPIPVLLVKRKPRQIEIGALVELYMNEFKNSKL